MKKKPGRQSRIPGQNSTRFVSFGVTEHEYKRLTASGKRSAGLRARRIVFKALRLKVGREGKTFTKKNKTKACACPKPFTLKSVLKQVLTK